MALSHKVAKGRSTIAKATATYAACQTGLSVVQRGADIIGHEWRVSEDYAEATYEAAMKIATERQAVMPGARQRSSVGTTHLQVEEFSAKTWTFLRGIAPGVQARMFNVDTIEFRAFRVKDLDAVKALVAEVEAEATSAKGSITISLEPASWTSIYGWVSEKSWQYRKDRKARSFNSVIIPEALQQEIQADLMRFSDSHDRLERLELPWRRGYMLSGPPGTGKTSLSLAIAGSLGFSLASLSLTDVKSDGELKKAISSLPARTVLVIEDIDANAVTHDREKGEKTEGELTLSGLLNALDGFETPDGMVAILTTNHIEQLDPALVRSGRMDRTFDLGLIEAREVERLFEWFYEKQHPTDTRLTPGPTGLSPADVTEVFKQHLDDPEAGWNAAIELINHRHLNIAA